MVEPVPTTTYRDIGTNIDCVARTLDDGRFRLDLSIEDSSVSDEEPGRTPARVGDRPVLRSFRSTQTVLLRDGQTVQYTTATDKVSGEVVKIDVTVNTIK